MSTISLILLGVRSSNNTVFFTLLRAGLWEQSCRLAAFEPIDFVALYELAEEQSVVGLIAAGLELVEDKKIVKQEAIPFLKRVYSVEGRNASMNAFIVDLVQRMRDADIYSVLVKGQGVAQCYKRPQWRSAGDIDFFLDEENYQKAKGFLAPLASHLNAEDTSRLHYGMTIDPWVVELHGTMRSEMSSRVDGMIDAVQRDIFQGGGIRVWRKDDVDIFLPNPDNDVILVFTHFLHHFYVGGIGLRQICDWCRLLWTYKDSIDRELLDARLTEMGLMTEWKAFAHFAVEWLGMSEEAMPFFSENERFKRKAEKVCNLILEMGNFGHNKDSSYRSKYPKMTGYFITFGRRLGEFVRLTSIFPRNAPRFFVTYVFGRTRAVL